MKGYFWANLNGTIVNWQVNRFRLYRGARSMDLLWELALEQGAVDEIMLSVPRTSAHASEVVREAGNDGFGDPLKDHPKHPEAFLTVTDGRQAKGAKYRLKGFRFLRCENNGDSADGAPSEDFHILLDLDKVERARVALPGANA
ncbi:MAG: hypothetical protein ACXVH0_03055 [Thermoanaerobaculia bacterium]